MVVEGAVKVMDSQTLRLYGVSKQKQEFIILPGNKTQVCRIVELEKVKIRYYIFWKHSVSFISDNEHGINI